MPRSPRSTRRSGVADHASAVSQSNANGLARARRLLQEHQHQVVAVLRQLVTAEGFILKEIEACLRILGGLHCKEARKLQHNRAVSISAGSHFKCGRALERCVILNRSVDRVGNRLES